MSGDLLFKTFILTHITLVQVTFLFITKNKQFSFYNFVQTCIWDYVIMHTGKNIASGITWDTLESMHSKPDYDMIGL